MNIKHPELLFLLILLPLFVYGVFLIWKKKNKLISALSKNKIQNLFPNFSKPREVLRLGLLCSAMLFFVLALISPRWGYDWKEVETKGTNILLAIDLSDSMQSTDISPNRLTKAKLEASLLVDKLAGDRVGLIIFAGDAFLELPLTSDYLMIKDRISELNTEMISKPGTSLRDTLEEAAKAFDAVKSEAKSLIIFSDGEEQDEATLAAAGDLAARGVRIFTVGIGTEEGSPINLGNGLLKDKNGNIVVSKLDDSLLKDIAKAANGEYFRSSGGSYHLDQIYYKHIKKSMSAETLKSGKTKRWRETYQVFMLGAFISLLLELLLSLNLAFKKKFFVLFLFLFSIQGAKANVLDPRLWVADTQLQESKYKSAAKLYTEIQSSEPHNPRLNYNLAIANYRRKDYSQALENALRSAKNPNGNKALRQAAFYNAGNAYFKQENYEAAISAYKEALKLNSKDEDAQFNLELAQKMLKKKKDPQDKQKQDQKQNQKKNQENKKQPQSSQKPKPKPQQASSRDLLKQIGEGKRQASSRRKQEKQSSNAKQLNPW